MSANFWETKKPADFTEEEWESICSHCGKCCLLKLEDEDSGDVYYTDVVCRYFDQQTGKCTCYQERCTLVPTCLKLSKDNFDKISWMPRGCAYRCLAEGRGLPQYHPLRNHGKPDDKNSICQHCISELLVNEEDLEDHIIEDIDA